MTLRDTTRNSCSDKVETKLGETKLFSWSSGKTAKKQNKIKIGLVGRQNKNNITPFLGLVFFLKKNNILNSKHRRKTGNVLVT